MGSTEGRGPRIRDAQPTDLPAVQAIYAHHVRFGLATFEEEPPDLSEFERVVHDWCEEVQGDDQRPVVGETIHGGVVPGARVHQGVGVFDR